MNIVEYPIGVRPAAPRDGVGALRCFRSSSLSDVIEAIWDLDVPDGDCAKGLIIKCAPGTSLQLIGQYRRPAEIRQGAELLPAKCATCVQSHAVSLRPTGALGVIIVCLRSDAASRIVGAPLGEFADANLRMENLFSAGEVAMCDEMLAAAATSQERFAGVQSFLLRHLRPRSDSLAGRAALLLRKDPALPIHALAARLDVSPRHLCRGFTTAFGFGPKRFARLTRFQRILAERRRGRSWSEVAYACGLTDQAHLVGEFQDIAGESPTAFFTRAMPIGTGVADEANLIIQRADRPITQG